MNQIIKAMQALIKENIHYQQEALVTYVCPVYSTNGSRFEHVGSSILLSIGPKKLLITAAHIILDPNKKNLWIPGKNAELYLDCEFILSQDSGELHSNRNYDFAYAILSSNIVNQLNDFYCFEKIENIDLFDRNYTGKLYTFLGFPNSRNKTRYIIKPQAHSYTCHSSQISAFTEYGLNEISYIMAQYKKGAVFDFDEKKSEFPKPVGISGGGIWRWELKQENFIGNIKIKPLLVGLINKITKDQKHWVGLKISHILESIRISYPELDTYIPRNPNIQITISAKPSSR